MTTWYQSSSVTRIGTSSAEAMSGAREERVEVQRSKGTEPRGKRASREKSQDPLAALESVLLTVGSELRELGVVVNPLLIG